MITQNLLRELFEYRDGELYWKVSNSPRVKIGDEAGGVDSKGYKRTTVNNKKYKSHRIIFLMHYGYLPKIIDHKDRNPLNNKIENLREATKSQNCQNRKIQANNTTNVPGVCWHKSFKKWMVQIQIDKHRKTIGYFKDLEFAELVSIMAREKHHGEFAKK